MLHRASFRGAFMFATTVLSAASLAASEQDAQACGGCFIPQENPTVVTDHRMILSIAKGESTLYDQIKYSGSPSAFAWVLPISGEVAVGLSADVVFTSLDQLTQTQLLAPPRNCPPRPDSCNDRSAKNASAPEASLGAAGDVTVTKREVVGPYETVQLKASTPTALRDWLAANGFNVPPDVAPVVDKYVAEKFDFLALKLLPGKGTQDMRPVRVTTKGANVALPLRMVAAGTGAVVGISLWVIGEGRYEPQNFASFLIPSEEIAWDWTQNKSNYVELRTAKTAAGGGKTWEVESSTDVSRPQLESSIRRGAPPTGPQPVPGADASGDYLPVKDAQGTETKSASTVRDEDVAALFNGIGAPRVTRLRADLAHAALDADLVMAAAKDQSVLPRQRQITKELNQPLCPVWTGCESTEQAPRNEAIARSAPVAGGETFTCGTTPHSTKTWTGLGLGIVALAELFRRRGTRAENR